LWQELVEKGNPAPAERVLIAEACRLADRLDRLDAISNGKDRAWLQISEEIADVTDGQVTVIVDKVLTEARQQQATLKQIIAELRQAGASAPAAGQGGSILDQLAARRAQRRSNAAG
jgi:F0F1-type ATP synthase epsilon subunit